MTTELTDVSMILQKVTQVANSAKEQGFNIKELEIESDDDDDELIFSYTTTNCWVLKEFKF